MAEGWRVVVAHGNGPQVGHILLCSELAIVEMSAVGALAEAGAVVIAAGSGGIPVAREDGGDLTPADAVVDKDWAAALLAVCLDADLLAISTAVERIALTYGRPDQIDLGRLTVEEARRHLPAGQFPPGSIAPKVEAAITSPKTRLRALRGEDGTWIKPAALLAERSGLNQVPTVDNARTR